MIPCTKIVKGLSSIHSEYRRGPLFVWNITAKCNLKCSHCYRDSDALSPDWELSDEKCLQLIDEIKELNPPMVLLTGGEPLLRKNVFDIVRKCKASGLRVGLSTNGTIIDEDTAKRIKASGTDYVGISIDGRQSQHDEFRGLKGAFQLSWAAIEYLNSLKVKTGVRFTLTDKNKADLLYILYRTFKSGVKRFCLYHLVYSGRGKAHMDMPPEKKKEVMERFFNIVKIMSTVDGDFEVLTTDNPADGVYMLGSSINDEAAFACIRSYGGCSAGEGVVYLDSTGKVYPCQFLRDEPLGNVMQRSLWDIWEDKHNAFLNQLRSKKNFLEGRCGRCLHKEICAGCRARAKAYSGSLWAEDPGCYLQESEVKDVALSEC